jgi:hypothetical protein
MEFGTTVTTTLGFDEAVARTREALGLPALQPEPTSRPSAVRRAEDRR